MTARHVAVAPLVVVKDRAGVDQYFYRGQEVVADIDADRLKTLAADGLIEGVKAPAVSAPAASDGPPAKSAKKAVWEAYAVAQGWSEQDAKSAKKDELVEALTTDPSGPGDGSDGEEEPESDSSESESD